MSDLRSCREAVDHFRLIIDATNTDSRYNEGFVDGLEFCISHLSTMPSVQPEITPDGTLKVTVDTDIASIGRILLSQTGTQYGGLYYKDAQPYTEEQLQKMQDLEQAQLEKAFELGKEDAKAEKALPSAQPEITEEQAIEHLQSTGWMQRHDRILTESTWDIIRCRDCKYYKDITSIHGECECGEMWQSLFGEVTEVEAIEVHKDHYCGYAERRTDECVD